MPYPNPAPGDAVQFHIGLTGDMAGTTLAATIIAMRHSGYVDVQVSDAGVQYTRDAVPLLDDVDPPRSGSWVSWPT